MLPFFKILAYKWVACIWECLYQVLGAAESTNWIAGTEDLEVEMYSATGENCQIYDIFVLKHIQYNCLINHLFMFRVCFFCHFGSFSHLLLCCLLFVATCYKVLWIIDLSVDYIACMISKHKCHLNRYKIRHAIIRWRIRIENHFTQYWKSSLFGSQEQHRIVNNFIYICTGSRMQCRWLFF